MNSTNLPTAQKQKFSVAISTEGYKNLINNTLGDPERSRRFIASITSAVAVNPALQDCTPGTILAGALLGESLNLSPSPQLGQYYLVPFKDRIKDREGKTVWLTDEKGNKVKDDNGKWIPLTESRAQFVLGFKGYIQLAIRSGQYKDIDVMEIHEGEYLGKDPDSGKPRFSFIEDDDARDAKPVVGYLAYFEYLNGFKKSLYWSKAKMLNHADQYSPAFSAEALKALESGKIAEADKWKYSSFWYKDFDGMAKKTMLRQLISKWGIMSIEMQQAFVQDSKFIQMENGNFVRNYEEPLQPDEPAPDAPAAQPEEQPQVVGQPEQTPQQVNLEDL